MVLPEGSGRALVRGGTAAARATTSIGSPRPSPADQGLARRFALIRGQPIDPAPDLEQRIDAADHIEGNRRNWRRRLAHGLAVGVRLQISQDEELPLCTRPAASLGDPAGFMEFALAAVGIGPRETDISSKMRLWVFAAAIARVAEQGRRRFGAAERAIKLAA